MMITDTATARTADRANSGFEKGSFNKEPEGSTTDMANGAVGVASAAMEKGKQLAEVAGVQAKEARDMMVTRIKDNPLAAVGIAFGAGIVLALLRK